MIRQAISCDICGTEKKQTNYWFVAYDQGGELRISGWNSRNRLKPGSKHLCGQTCLHMLVDEYMAREVAARGQLRKESAEAAEAELEAAREAGLHAEQHAELHAESLTSREALLEKDLARERAQAQARELEQERALARERDLAGECDTARERELVRERARMDLDAAEQAALLDEECSARLIATPEAEPPKRPVYRPPVEFKPLPGRPSQETMITDAHPDEPPVYATRNWRVEAWQRERDRQAKASNGSGYGGARKRSVS